MSDLFLGQTCTEAYTFQSAAAEHTFTFNFQPDKVTFYNLTAWTATAGKIPISIWFRDQTTTAYAYQEKVIEDSASNNAFNFLQATTNGFTDASDAGGAPAYRSLVSAISQADPCVVTTSSAHGFQTNQMVRFTDLGDVGVTDRGMSDLNNNRYLITVLTSTTFSLQDAITDEDIDSTGFVTYVSGGRVDVESRVISLNNPQQYPYQTTPYSPNPFQYDAPTYSLTAGTAVMGTDNDLFLIEVIKYGEITALGDLA
jgi:hypothetical protein